MALTLRLVKGTTLTFEELDDNFVFLSSSKLETNLSNLVPGSISSPTQGTLQVGGTNVDLGLQIGDSPTFANLITTGDIRIEGDLSVTGSAILKDITYVPTVTTIYNGTTVSIKTIDATSTEAVFFDYSIKSANGAHKRAGGAIIMWSTPDQQIQFTEYSTLDFGDTSAAIVSASISGMTVNVTVQNDTGHTLTVKSLARLF